MDQLIQVHKHLQHQDECAVKAEEQCSVQWHQPKIGGEKSKGRNYPLWYYSSSILEYQWSLDTSQYVRLLGIDCFHFRYELWMCLCPDITRSCLLERSLDLLRRNMVQERYMERMEVTSFEINKWFIHSFDLKIAYQNNNLII